MRSGLLNNIIEILRPQKVYSEYGEEKTEYVSFYKTRAQIKYNKTSNDEENYEKLFTNRKSLVVRYYVPVEDFDRIKLNNTVYRILDINRVREWNQIEIEIEKINE